MRDDGPTTPAEAPTTPAFFRSVPKPLKIGCAVLWMAPLGLIGAGMVALAAAALWSGNGGDALGFLVFAAIFGGVGAAPWLALRWLRRRLGREPEEGSLNAPWRLRPEWRSPTLHPASDPSSTAISRWFVILWNAIGWTAAVQLTLVNPPTEPVAWLAWIFPVSGLWMLWKYLYPELQRRRYGASVFEMEPFPAAVGDAVRGRIRIERKGRALLDEPVTLTLGCYERAVRQTRDGDGDTKRRVYLDELWSSKQTAWPRAASDDEYPIEVPVAFEVPPGLDAATIPFRPNRTLWRLDAEVERSGLDYSVGFELPVLAPETLEAPAEEPRALEPIEAEGGGDEAVAEVAAEPEARELVSAYGEEPWLHRPAWRTPRIAAESPSNSWSLIVWACVWLGITGGAAALFASGAGEGGSPALFIVFGLIGLGVLALGVYRMLRARKYQHAALVLDPLPGAVGGTVAGRVETDIAEAQAPADGFHVQLTCYRRSVRRDSDGRRSVSHDPLWRDEARMRPIPRGDGTHVAVPFAFRIPPDARESTPTAKPDRIAWKVEVRAEMPGIDYGAAFEVPVFVVEGRSSAVPADDAVLEAAAAYAEAEIRRTFTAPVSDGVRMEPTAGGGVRFSWGQARHPGTAALLSVLAVVLWGLVVVIGFGSLLALLILLVMAGVLSYGAWHYWTYASSVTVEGGRITVESGSFGTGTVEELPCTALAGTELTTRSDGKYDLYLVRGDLSDAEAAALHQRQTQGIRTVVGGLQRLGLASRGRQADAQLLERLEEAGVRPGRIRAALALDDRQEAEWMAARIEAAAGVCADHASTDSTPSAALAGPAGSGGVGEW